MVRGRNVYFLAGLAYLGFSVCDAGVKTGGEHFSVFESAFFVNLAAACVLLMTRHRGERWRDFWRMDRPLVAHSRALCGVVTSVTSIYSLTVIPLAQVYALVFLAPIFVTILSTLVLREQISIIRWITVAIGFAGVLLAIRPGFMVLNFGHLAALTCGLSTGTTIIILRGFAGEAKKTSILGMLLVYLVGFNGVMMVLEGFQAPTWHQLLPLAIGGACYGLGQWAFVAAARAGPAYKIAPMHYTQLGWGILFGAALFSEYPDNYMIGGIAVIALAGVINALSVERWLQRRRSREPIFRS